MHAHLPSVTSYRSRRDGWTVERQVGFLTALASSGSVTQAAATVGMSRESAYRLRTRDASGLFVALWDEKLAPKVRTEGHNRVLDDGDLERLLGNNFRRENNSLGTVGLPGPAPSPG